MAGVGITVDGRIANVFEELRAAVLDDGQVEQFRMVVDEVDVIRTGDEFRLLRTLIKKPMLVLTPRIRNSLRTRSIFSAASLWVRP
jgi:hypothetical protein